VLMQLFFSRITAKWKPMLAIALGNLLYVIGFTMYGFVNTYFMFLLAMVIITIGEMIYAPKEQTLVANFAPVHMRGRYMAIRGFSWIIPTAIGPLLVTSVISLFTIKATPWLMIPGITVSIALSILLRNMPHHNVNANAQTKLPIKQLMTILLPLAGVMFMRSPMRAASEIYLPVYLVEKGVNKFLAGSSVSMLLGFGVLGTIAGGYLKDKYGFKKVIIGSVSVASISMVIFSLTSGIIQIISLALLGTTSMMILPVGLAFVQENFPNNRSLANGSFLAITFGLNAIAGIATGFMYDKLGGNSTFIVSGLVSFLGIPFIFLLPKESKAG